MVFVFEVCTSERTVAMWAYHGISSHLPPVLWHCGAKAFGTSLPGKALDTPRHGIEISSTFVSELTFLDRDCHLPLCIGSLLHQPVWNQEVLSNWFYLHPNFQCLGERWAFFADGWRNHQLNITQSSSTYQPPKAIPPELRALYGPSIEGQWWSITPYKTYGALSFWWR